MNPAWTEVDKKATLIARENYLNRNAGSNVPFELFVKDAYEFVRENQIVKPPKKVVFH